MNALRIASIGEKRGTYATKDFGADSVSGVIAGLVNGVTYEFLLTAVTSGGEGAGTAISASPAARASAPTAVTVLASSNNQIRLQWMAPDSDGGSAVNSYQIRVWALGNLIQL